MKKFVILVLLILLIHLILLVNLRFTAWPEMILWPYLLSKGLRLYQDIVIIYPPTLIMVLFYLNKIFGATLLNLKIYTWILILLTDLILFFVTKKITQSTKIALISLAFYVVWQPFFEGNSMWFDLVLAPLGLLIFYFLIQKKLFWSGFFLGTALVIKQTGFWFFPPLVTCWVLREFKRRSLFSFAVGLIFPIIICLGYLFGTRLWPNFYQWAIDFGIFYLPRAPGQILLPTIKQSLSLGIPYGLGLISIASVLTKKEIKNKNLILVLLFWCFFAALGVYPRFEYFHFQPSLPYLAILSGILISSINLSYKKPVFITVLIVIILGTLYLQGRFYYLNWQKETRFYDTKTLDLGVWIKSQTIKGEKIYILNCWDHLYALSDTLPSVSPLIHTLPWHLEYPGMQEKYIGDLKIVKPKTVVFCPYSEKGLGSYKPEKIDSFLLTFYQKVKMINGAWILKPK